MTALYLLDTNIFIAALKAHPEVRQRLESLPLSTLRLSAIVLGELAFGAEKSAHGERNRARVASLAQRLPLVGIDYDTTPTMRGSGPCWNGRGCRSGRMTHGSPHRR